jgi:hypothetical protein
MAESGDGLIADVRKLPQSWRYVLLGVGSLALAIAGAVIGPAIDPHPNWSVSHLVAGLLGLAGAVSIAMFRMAYITGVRDPSMARKVSQMVQVMAAGQPLSGRFAAGLRDLAPGAPPARWQSGRVRITPCSVTWTRGARGRARDLTGAQCTGERHRDRDCADASLRLPDHYEGESIRVITLHANGSDVELAAPAQLLEILRYSVGRTAVRHP